jgi:hypothetical protein
MAHQKEILWNLGWRTPRATGLDIRPDQEEPATDFQIISRFYESMIVCKSGWQPLLLCKDSPLRIKTVSQ